MGYAMEKQSPPKKESTLAETMRQILNKANKPLNEYTRDVIIQSINDWDGDWGNQPEPLKEFIQENKDHPYIAIMINRHKKHVEQMNRLHSLAGNNYG